jgi:hypothetical protein
MVETETPVSQETQENPAKKVATVQKAPKENQVNRAWTELQACQVTTVPKVRKVEPLKFQSTFQLPVTSVHQVNEVSEVNQVFKVNPAHEVHSVLPVNVVLMENLDNEARKVNL